MIHHHKKSRYFLYTPINKIGACIIMLNRNNEDLSLNDFEKINKNSLLNDIFNTMERLTICKKYSVKQKLQTQRQVIEYWKNNTNFWKSKIQRKIYEIKNSILNFEFDDEELCFNYLVQSFDQFYVENQESNSVNVLRIDVLKNSLELEKINSNNQVLRKCSLDSIVNDNRCDESVNIIKNNNEESGQEVLEKINLPSDNISSDNNIDTSLHDNVIENGEKPDELLMCENINTDTLCLLNTNESESIAPHTTETTDDNLNVESLDRDTFDENCNGSDTYYTDDDDNDSDFKIENSSKIKVFFEDDDDDSDFEVMTKRTPKFQSITKLNTNKKSSTKTNSWAHSTNHIIFDFDEWSTYIFDNETKKFKTFDYMDKFRMKFNEIFPCTIYVRDTKITEKKVYIYSRKCKQPNCERLYVFQHEREYVNTNCKIEESSNEKLFTIKYKGHLNHTTEIATRLQGKNREIARSVLKTKYVSCYRKKLMFETNLELKKKGNLGIYKGTQVLDQVRKEAL